MMTNCPVTVEELQDLANTMDRISGEKSGKLYGLARWLEEEQAKKKDSSWIWRRKPTREELKIGGNAVWCYGKCYDTGDGWGYFEAYLIGDHDEPSSLKWVRGKQQEEVKVVYWRVIEPIKTYKTRETEPAPTMTKGE